MSLAVCAFIGAWQVGIDLLSSTDDARALRYSGIAILFVFSVAVLIWGFWRGKTRSIRFSRGLRLLRVRPSDYPESVSFDLKSKKDLRGKSIEISCDVPIRIVGFRVKRLATHFTYRMVAGCLTTEDENGTKINYRAGDIIELTPKMAQSKDWRNRVESINQRIGKEKLIGEEGSDSEDIRRIDPETVVFDFSSDRFAEPFDVLLVTLSSSVSIKWIEVRLIKSKRR